MCEITSNVKECALRARSTHGVHHAIVEVIIVIGVVHGEVLVARVVPLVVDAVTGLALSLIAMLLLSFFHRSHTPLSVTVNCCWLLPNLSL